MRPSPTSLYGLIIQAPFTSHLIASYTRAGVFCCPKGDPSSSLHIPVEGHQLTGYQPSEAPTHPIPEGVPRIKKISERQPNKQTIYEHLSTIPVMILSHKSS
ncbi:hypothetical protein BgiMline_015438 [Biomphalaria glabrata]